MPAIDYAILLAFVAYAITSGFLNKSKASRSLESYFLADRSLKGWQAGTSMSATQFAADTPLLVVGLIATAGVFAVWRLWVYGIAFLVMAFVFAAMWRRARVVTDAELTDVRYSGKAVLPLRAFKAVYYGTIFNCVVLAQVLMAAVLVAEVFLPWHEWIPNILYVPLGYLGEKLSSFDEDSLTQVYFFASGRTGLHPSVANTNNIISIAVIFGFTALYSITGGLRAVVATDIVQFIIMMIGTFLFAGFAVHAAGGSIPGLMDAIGAIDPALLSTNLSFAPPASEIAFGFLALLSMQWLFQINADGTGYLAQRTMACRSDRDATAAGVWFAFLQITLRSLPWLLIGAALLVLYPLADDPSKAAREATFVRAMNEHLPVGVRGIMLTAMIAALASTLDTHLNWGAGYWSNDLYGRVWCRAIRKKQPSSKALVKVARLSNVLILLIALVIMTKLDSIADAWRISLLYGSGVGGVLVLRWLWWRINAWSELAAIAVSIPLAPVLLILTDKGVIPDGDSHEWIRLGIMALATTSAAIIAAYVAPPTDRSTLESFDQRVRPLGFWNVPGRKADLARALLAAAAASVTVLGSLFGFARLLLPIDDTSLIRAIIALVIAAAVSPIWIRALRATSREPDPVPASEPPAQPQVEQNPAGDHQHRDEEDPEPR